MTTNNSRRFPVSQTQLSVEMKAAGMEWPDGQERWNEALEALKGVWASKFNERAYISMRKVRFHALNRHRRTRWGELLLIKGCCH